MQEKFNVTLSLDGGVNVNDQNRFFPNGEGAYNSTVQRTKMLRENGATGIRGTITNIDLDLIGRWRDLKELHVKNINFSPSVNMMEDTDYEKMIISYKDAINVFCESIRNNEGNEIKNMGFVSKIFDKIQNGGVRIKNCGAENNMVAIDKDGNLYPCHRLVSFEKYRIGDINKGLDKEKCSMLEQEMLIKNYEKCQKCWLSSFCCGGCIQENLLMEGKSNEPYYNYCKYMREITEYAVKQYLELLEDGYINV